MDRYREFETLSQAVRDGLPRVAVQWLAAARRPLETLTRAALDPEISDEEFRKMVEEFSEKLPELYDKLDVDALQDHLEGAMGAAMANGLAARLKTARPKTQDKK